MQLALLRQWKRQARPDWTAWNQALAMIWLVGTPAVREAAKQMDRAFWLCGARIKSGQLASEDAWVEERDAMELTRRDFINAARREPVGAREPVSDIPVARPPLTEIRQMFGSLPSRSTKTRSGGTTVKTIIRTSAHQCCVSLPAPAVGVPSVCRLLTWPQVSRYVPAPRRRVVSPAVFRYAMVITRAAGGLQDSATPIATAGRLAVAAPAWP